MYELYCKAKSAEFNAVLKVMSPHGRSIDIREKLIDK